MTPEISLLAAVLKSRAAFDLAKDSPVPDTFAGEAALLWAFVALWYGRDPEASRVDPAILAGIITQDTRDPKRREALLNYLSTVEAAETSPANTAEYLRALHRSRIGDELATALSLRRGPAIIGPLLESYKAIESPNQEEAKAPPSWEEALTKRASREGALFVSPKALNEALGGGVLPGHNMTIFARPEAGKTAFAINMACGFAKKGHKVLYVGNEDPVEDMAVRALSNLLGAPASELVKNPAKAAKDARAAGADNLIFRDICPGSIEEVERMVREYGPAVLVVDQLRNLSGGKSDNYVQHLDRMAQAVRALGKKYGMVTVSVTQAGDSASGKPVLGMGDIDSSNTGIPGAADVLIGIGVTETLENAGIRMVSLPKNKLSGKHGTFEVRIDTLTSRIR